MIGEGADGTGSAEPLGSSASNHLRRPSLFARSSSHPPLCLDPLRPAFTRFWQCGRGSPEGSALHGKKLFDDLASWADADGGSLGLRRSDIELVL